MLLEPKEIFYSIPFSFEGVKPSKDSVFKAKAKNALKKSLLERRLHLENYIIIKTNFLKQRNLSSRKAETGVIQWKQRNYSFRQGLIKLERAYGGCLGTRSRRRTRQAAISYGEPQIGLDP